MKAKRRAWWEEEWFNEYQKQDTIDWLKKETITKEIQDRQNAIIFAYKKEIYPLRDAIKVLENQIKKLQEECVECVVKIQATDTGWMEFIEEKNTSNSTQIQETKEQE